MKFHNKVYQKGPINMEITSTLTKGFVEELNRVVIAIGPTNKLIWAKFVA